MLAPTGTIAFMMDCDTTGIEPDIALIKYKKLVGEGFLKIVNQTVPAALRKLGYTPAQVEEIVAYINERETIEGAPGLQPEHLPVFDCAFKPVNGERSIHYMGHVRMMGAVQPFLSGAISKTVNMPEAATAEEIEQVYLEGWKLGLKAIAIYRDGSKRSPAAQHRQEEGRGLRPRTRTRSRACAGSSRPPRSRPPSPHRRRLPDERTAVTHKFEIAGHEGYITVGLYPDGQPGEIFLKMAKEGSTIGGLMDTLGDVDQPGAPVRRAAARPGQQVRPRPLRAQRLHRQPGDPDRQVDRGLHLPLDGLAVPAARGAGRPRPDRPLRRGRRGSGRLRRVGPAAAGRRGHHRPVRGDRAHPYDEITWEYRTAGISSETGKTVFEQKDVEVPVFWSQLATNVVVSKYFRGHVGTPEREHSVKQLIDRVVTTIAAWADTQRYFATDEDLAAFQAELTHLLVHQKMSFNSPVWFNVGIEAKPQCSACFINSVQDNMSSIMDLAKTEAMLFKYGSGTGVEPVPIRSSKAREAPAAASPAARSASCAATTRSPASSSRAARPAAPPRWSSSTWTIRTSSSSSTARRTRRRRPGPSSSRATTAPSTARPTAASSSRTPTTPSASRDEFMKAVERDAEWQTHAVTDGQPAGTYKAREIFRKMADAATCCGDPGHPVRHAPSTDWHTSPDTAPHHATNPCSEYMFLNDTAATWPRST